MQEMKPSLSVAFISTFIYLSTSVSGFASLKNESQDESRQDFAYGAYAFEPCKPQHVHLSFSDTVQQMNIVWATTRYCQNCQVKYGTDAWNLHYVSSSTYNNFIEKNEQGLQHLYKAKLENLSPNTTYHYLPLCEGISSGPHFFKIPRNDLDWTPDFLVFGDLGVESEFFTPLMTEAQSGQYTAIFHVGDFAYDFDHDRGKKGDKFMELIEPASAYTPYMTCPGNHEIELGTFSHYRNRFTMPGSDWPIPVDQMWYSFDIGHVHFISYSTEVFFTNSAMFVEDQRAWLLKDLEKANKNRQVTPWVITFGHRPLYCSTHMGDDCSMLSSLVRNGLEDIFRNFSVDIVLQAHEHNYERLWPVYRGRVTSFSYVNADAPIQLISGAPGNREGEDHFPNNSRPEWSAFRMDDGVLNSYGRLLIVNSTHIWWEQRKANNHVIIDSIWIIKDEIQGPVATKPSPPGRGTKPFTRDSRPGNIFSKYSHVLIVSIVGSCLVVFITLVVVRLVLRVNRKKAFNQAWQTFDSPERDDKLDEKEDEPEDSTSLL